MEFFNNITSGKFIECFNILQHCETFVVSFFNKVADIIEGLQDIIYSPYVIKGNFLQIEDGYFSFCASPPTTPWLRHYQRLEKTLSHSTDYKKRLILKQQCLGSSQMFYGGIEINFDTLKDKDCWLLIKSVFQQLGFSCDLRTISNSVVLGVDAYQNETGLKYDTLINNTPMREWNPPIVPYGKDYKEKCLAEVKRMKEQLVVGKNLSLYDLVMREKDYSLQDVQENRELAAGYEVYSDVIGAALEAAFDRRKILEELEKTMIFTSSGQKTVRLGYGVVPRLLSQYLEVDEMSNLIKAYS